MRKGFSKSLIKSIEASRRALELKENPKAGKKKARRTEHQIIREKHRRMGLKATCCAVCGSTERLRLHHNKYTIEPDVTTLCLKCHALKHPELNKILFL